jgi:hypothetical protein
VAAAVVAVVCFGYVVYSTGAITFDDAPIIYNEDQMRALSPLLVRGIVLHKTTLNGMLNATMWHDLDAHGREDAADKLAKALAHNGVTAANLTANRREAVKIEQGLVSFVDKDPQH